MEQTAFQTLDVELGLHEIQSLNGPATVAAFFARLRYNTDARILQTPGNLGITAEGALQPIKRIELLANQEGMFQVYLFELMSVTVAHTRSLARAFRNLAGNFLLVLTSDYERIDFVLLEKYLPVGSDAGGLAQKQTAIRPRVLTVNRRKPERVHLRVLRRFTWTETDPFAQYHKLLSAYAVADWSEEFFNNRALFSDYYLLERLRDFPVWTEDPKPAYRSLRELYRGAAGRFGGKTEDVLRKELFEPVFQSLGFEAKPGKKAGSSAEEPDYQLFSPGKSSSPLALCLAYPWGRFLDGKDSENRDKETPDENPGAVVVSLLEKGEAPWAVVTNGKLWRLYAQRTHSRATNYYEIDLEEVLADIGPHAADLSDSFRYFWLLFRRHAFETAEVEREGKKVSLSLLDRLLLESEDYAKELGERLKERVFEQVFPHLATGFIAHLRGVGFQPAGVGQVSKPAIFSKPEDGRLEICPTIDQPDLDAVFQGTLTLLYRLLFLLYAEARDLLPVREVRGYFEASLNKMKREVAEAAGPLADETDENLEKHYREDRCDLYDRITRLFQIIDQGDPALNVPLYNGGLFLSDPPGDDDSPEAQNARFLNKHRVPDRFLAKALDLLARDEDPKRHDLVFIDYKSLGVRQLGSIYEGLLEFRLRIAPEKMAVVKGQKTEEVIPYQEAQKEGLTILKEGRGKDAKERMIPQGAVYLENDKRERKATGSYYTPDHIVKYIVEHAVGPVLQEKFEALRPKLRQAQQERRSFLDTQEALRKQGMRTKPDSQADLIARELVDELFDLKALDPAMGSGHFLVEAVDFITDKALNFLNGFPWNPVFAHLARMKDTILKEMDEQGITINASRLTDVNLLKRYVLKRCIYGVDLNPMAVELAKVSLWLDCFTLGAPLSFLDHHLRCGNSLIGVTVKEVQTALEKSKTLFGVEWAGLLLATDLMRRIGGMPDVTSAQVRQSRTEYRRAVAALEPFKRILDLYTSRWFGNSPNAAKSKSKGKKKEPVSDPVLDFLNSPEAKAFFESKDRAKAFSRLSDSDRSLVDTAFRAAGEKRFFHWELEFPEVFYGPKPGTTQAIERLDTAGFDAVIGNPPYDVLASEELGRDVSQDLAFLESVAVFGPAVRGSRNLYKFFICRGLGCLAPQGFFSFIVPMSLLGDEQAVGIRKLLLQDARLNCVEAFPQKDVPANRVFLEAKLSTAVFVAKAQGQRSGITVRTNPGRLIDENSSALVVTADEVATLNSENLALPSCSQRDWDIATSILTSKAQRMEDVVTLSEGEVHAQTHRDFIAPDNEGPEILRGANVTLYALRESSQGEKLRLDVQRYLEGKKEDTRAYAHRERRVGFQRSAPQNNFRRLIAAMLPPGAFCFDTIKFVPENASEVELDLVIAFLNSKILDWYFRLASTNSKVNEYQFNALPVPTISAGGPDIIWRPLLEKERWPELAHRLCAACTEPGVMPQPVADALAALSRRIQDIESKRVLKSRSERSHLAPESQPIQDAIDKVLFRCYGLSNDDARYIIERLKEML